MKPIFYIFSFLSITLLFSASGYLHYKLPRTYGDNDKLAESLNKNVDVYYDQFGIPHIEAKSIKDAYTTFGYIMASQRLFQMDVFRRLVNGTLSEIFGKKSLKADQLLRTLQLKRNAQKQLEDGEISPEVKLILSSFINGIHKYVDTSPLPVEFDLLGYKPHRFEIADIMAISGYMALTFSEGITGDILNSDLLQFLPEEKMEIIRIGSNADVHYFDSDKSVKSNIINTIHSALDEVSDVFAVFHGSNSWVLSGQRTSSGKPILANDPHIATSNPHVFYEAHIKAGKFEVYGNFLPLVPLAVMGHTPHSAWGITMAEIDDINLYDEKINPEDSTQVMYKNEWVALEEIQEVIKVKDSDNFHLTVRNTPHGPILNATDFSLKGKTLALSWSVNHKNNNIVQSLYELPLAQSVDELKTALSHGAAPALNISWVNSSGDIAWWVLGKFPKLPDGVATDMILDGAQGTHEIERYYSIDENPHEVNPESGVITTANYRPQGEAFAHFFGYWQPGGRFDRIEKLLSKQTRWTVEELKKIQTDNRVPIIDEIQLQFQKGVKIESLTLFEKSVFNHFLEWDGYSTKSDTGSSIYHLWNYYNMKNVFSDELGEENYLKFGRTANFWHAYKKLLFSLNHSFWDNIETDRVESGVDIITESFKKTAQELRQKFGDDISRWKWGKLHTVEYKHPLGLVTPLNYVFNIGPVAADGGRYVINNLGHDKSSKDFSVVHGPATRRLIDMNNPRESLAILPTGNSGNFLSKHFDDQLKLYHSGQYRVQEMNWEKIKQSKRLKFSSNSN